MVATSALLKPLTVEDWEEFPETTDQFEILQGELFVTPAPRPEHGDVSLELYTALDRVVRRMRLGKVYVAPVGVRLSQNDIVQPDLFFVPVAKRTSVRRGIIDAAPDLVVEILSPSTRHLDLVRKKALYATTGVAEYWIVDLDTRSIEVHVLDDGEYRKLDQPEGIVRSQAIEGVEIDIEAIFNAVWWPE